MSSYNKTLSKISTSTFSTKMANEIGLDSYGLKTLIEAKSIRRVARGVYKKSSADSNENDEMLASLVQVGSPSCVCLLSALYYYGVTDEIPDQVWIYLPYGKFTHLKTIKVIRKRNPMWDIGIDDINDLRICSIERALIDSLCDKKHFTEVDSIKYTKIALEENLTTVSKLFDMAKKLKVERRVKFILTLLLESYV